MKNETKPQKPRNSMEIWEPATGYTLEQDVPTFFGIPKRKPASTGRVMGSPHPQGAKPKDVIEIP